MIGAAIWNLFLALVPVALGRRLAREIRGPLRAGLAPRVGLAGVGLLWLLLLPNACYLLTEFRHLLFDARWRSITAAGSFSRDAMFASAAWAAAFAACGLVGILLFTLALRPVHRALSARGVAVAAWAPALFLLASLGTYLGLVYRLNSWDAWTHPASILEALADTLSRPRSVLAIVAFGGFLAAAYAGVGIWVDRGTERLDALRASRDLRTARDRRPAAS